MHNDNSAILKELKELKELFLKLIGTADQSVENRFSEEALNKAAKDFLKMSIERGEWVKDDDFTNISNPLPGIPGLFSGKNLLLPTGLKEDMNIYIPKKT